jgi:hypothetical protein
VVAEAGHVLYFYFEEGEGVLNVLDVAQLNTFHIEEYNIEWRV